MLTLNEGHNEVERDLAVTLSIQIKCPHLRSEITLPLNVAEGLLSQRNGLPYHNNLSKEGKVKRKCTPIQTWRTNSNYKLQKEIPNALSQTPPLAPPNLRVSCSRIDRIIYLVSTDCFRSVWHTSSCPTFQELLEK